MTLIRVPRPPQSAYNPDRPTTSLLKSQVEHLQEAERKLPLRYRSELYGNAIKTEGEAARYIRDVTEAIHAAHEDAERARRAPKRRRGIEIAAVADVPAERARARKRAAAKAKGGKKPARKK
jgi:hypothetical protein